MHKMFKLKLNFRFICTVITRVVFIYQVESRRGAGGRAQRRTGDGTQRSLCSALQGFENEKHRGGEFALLQGFENEKHREGEFAL